jgi:hypothetical protein
VMRPNPQSHTDPKATITIPLGDYVLVSLLSVVVGVGPVTLITKVGAGFF